MKLLGRLFKRRAPSRLGFHADMSRFPDALTEGQKPLLMVVPEPIDEPIDEPPPVKLRVVVPEPNVEDVKVAQPPELYLLRVESENLVKTVRVTIGPDGKWYEHDPIPAESLTLAREMVPLGATPRKDCPRSYADECWEVRL